MDNKLKISQLAYECAQNSANKNKEALTQNMQDLKTTMATFDLNEQYQIMARLQNPNNVNGALPAVEYAPVRDCFMQNLADYYSQQVVFQEEFENQTSAFSLDQLEALRGALETAQIENFPANSQLSQNGINVTSTRFDGYINQIDTQMAKITDLDTDFSM